MNFFNRARLARRGFLESVGVGFAGVTLPNLLWADDRRRATGTTTQADHCILIFLNGGPSHLDMWDPKPDAPTDIRGEFGPIATSLPGVQFSEHLPRMARHMHRSAVIRSAHHLIGHAHGAAVYTAITGHDRGDTTQITPTGPNDYPSIGSVMTHLRPPEQLMVPFVNLPYTCTEGIGGPPQAGFFGGMMGKGLDPLCVFKDPNAPDFKVPDLSLPVDVAADRLTRRQSLQETIDVQFAGRRTRGVAGVEGFRERAFSLLSSSATQRAFQISEEPDRTRDAYGRNIYGQSVLLARRLIEAGTRVVSVPWSPDANATWDTHWDHVNRLKNELLPPLDMAVGSLLDDLVERDLFDRTLVVVMGEFGRAPRISEVPGYPLPGRTHWPFCYSLFMAGGGIKQGYIHGASDKIGGNPVDKPVIPAEIIATIYKALGIPHTFEFHDLQNRPQALVPWGEPIQDMFA
ncbi:MAG: DUF1501 domain-containing protein [Planctomycetia bacterium]|nr:DUF1501 domain-containing protein [Planctomycetia bacterium]